MKINDVVRGQVAWNTDTLGDFVILRSNGQPVYNFCVAVDDALMGITHVLRCVRAYMHAACVALAMHDNIYILLCCGLLPCQLHLEGIYFLYL